jgi:hypothetical protein
MSQKTVKEACLQAMETIKKPATSNEITNTILQNAYYNFDMARTPQNTVNAQLGDFIRRQDSRVTRFKGNDGVYRYYLTKNSHEMVLQDTLNTRKQETYKERDLHPLLSTYLQEKGIKSHTIYHEKSNRKDSEQKWIHPDMIGVEFFKFEIPEIQQLIRTINGLETFRLYSYELKKEIRNDSDLKAAYFQAVSNSSWAHYGYLVAFEINSALMGEMERLSKSFGIGIIELRANPFESKVLFPAQYSDLDMQTVDKIAKVNSGFRKYLDLIEKVLSADDKYRRGAERDIDEVNERILSSDADIKAYCDKQHIPYEDEDN